MPNRVVLFPAAKKSSADAYKAFCDANWPGAPDVFTLVLSDAYGQWKTAFLGPPFVWNGDEVAEPEGGAAARADGVLADTWTPPPPDDE